MVDALALGASGATHGGSSPLPRTNNQPTIKLSMKLSTLPYKGSKDFYPEDQRIHDYIFNAFRSIVKLYGYEEYNAPIIESLELYKAKSGEEIINHQTYNFIDRGGREVAIRPEMTPSVSRMVAAKREQLVYPLRWFSIPNLWRYERPQNGRYREHWQLNVDIFGINNIYAELELLTVIKDIMSAFKADSSMYQLKINSRALMNDIFADYLKLDQEQAYKLAKAIDRKNKITEADFIEIVDSILQPVQLANGLTEKIIHLLSYQQLNKLPKQIQEYNSFKDLDNLLKTCQEQELDNVEFDITIVRGFDYYTGIVFELYDTHPQNNRAMLGGGRYDGLVGLFGVKPIDTVGFGFGDATLLNFLKLHNLLPELKTDTKIYTVIINDEYTYALKVVNQLRHNNISVAVDFSKKKIGEQIKTAHKKGINLVLIIGPAEHQNQKFTLRELNSSTEISYSLEKLIPTIKQKIG